MAKPWSFHIFHDYCSSTFGLEHYCRIFQLVRFVQFTLFARSSCELVCVRVNETNGQLQIGKRDRSGWNGNIADKLIKLSRANRGMFLLLKAIFACIHSSIGCIFCISHFRWQRNWKWVRLFFSFFFLSFIHLWF